MYVPIVVQVAVLHPNQAFGMAEEHSLARVNHPRAREGVGRYLSAPQNHSWWSPGLADHLSSMLMLDTLGDLGVRLPSRERSG